MGLAEKNTRRRKKDGWGRTTMHGMFIRLLYSVDPGPYFLQLSSSRIFPLGARISLITGDRIRSSAIAPHLASATNVA